MPYKHVDIKQCTYKLKRIVYRLKERQIAELIQVDYTAYEAPEKPNEGAVEAA